MFSMFVTFSNPFSAICIYSTYAYPVPFGSLVMVYLIVQFSKYTVCFLWSDLCMYSLWLNSRITTNLCCCFFELCPVCDLLSTFWFSRGYHFLVHQTETWLYLSCSAISFPQTHPCLGSSSRRTETMRIPLPTWEHSCSNWWKKFSSSESWAPISPHWCFCWCHHWHQKC